MDLNSARIAALTRLIGKEPLKDYAQRFHLNASYLSQLLNGHRELGEKAALGLEDKLGLPPLTLCYPQELRSPADAEGQPQLSLHSLDQLDLSMSWARLNSAISLVLTATPAQMSRAAAVLEKARDEFAEKLPSDVNRSCKP